jgi:hypothetical protein
MPARQCRFGKCIKKTTDISGHCTIHREALSAEQLANIKAHKEQYAENGKCCVPQCRDTDIDPATGACSNHTEHIQNNNAAGLDAATVNPETFPMQVLDFHCFKEYGQIVQHETLRAERSKMLVDSRGLDRKKSVLFFVSHQWLTSGTALNVTIRSGEHAQGEGRLANYPPKGAWPADEPEKAFEVLLKGGAKMAVRGRGKWTSWLMGRRGEEKPTVQILGKDLIREIH